MNGILLQVSHEINSTVKLTVGYMGFCELSWADSVFNIPRGERARFLFVYLFFIFGCTGSSRLCADFLQLCRQGLRLQVPPWGGLACCGARGLGPAGFRSCGAPGSGARLSSCGTRAQLLRSMRRLPRLGTEPCPLHWQVDS